jgi:hypothetical protein
MRFTVDGILSGIPRVSGTFALMVRLLDESAHHQEASQRITFVIAK